MSSSIDETIAKAEELVDAFQFEQARQHLEPAVVSTSNLDALQLYAAICIELGDARAAHDALQRAVQLQPSAGPDKFLALAQLSSGQNALDLYTQGIALFRQQPSPLSPEDSWAVATAMCAVAELYMTDLCEHEQAEMRCEECLQHAQTICSSNPEVYRVGCDLRLVQQRFDDAQEMMDKCLSCWAETEHEDSGNHRVSFEFRVAVAKLLIELKRWEDAEAILEQAIEEDDEAVLPWYLLGVACAMRPAPDLTTSVESLRMAERLIVRESDDERDVELLESVREFLTELEANNK